jgi:CHAT domain-containing protein/Tfp pilus assembly protein PilF
MAFSQLVLITLLSSSAGGQAEGLRQTASDASTLSSRWGSAQKASAQFAIGTARQSLNPSQIQEPVRTDCSAVAQKTLDEGQKLIAEGSAESLRKAIEKLEQAAQVCRVAGDRGNEGLMLNGIGFVYGFLSDHQKAREYYERALPLRRAVGDRAGEAVTLSNLGFTYDSLGQKEKALSFYEQALSICRAVGDRVCEGKTLNNVASLYGFLGQKQKAIEIYDQALQIFRAANDRQSEATILNNLGGIYHELGEKQKAIEFYNQTLAIQRSIGNRRGEAVLLNNLGGLYQSIGEKEKALEYYNQALPIRRLVGDRRGEANTITNIGTIYDDLGDKQKALEFYNRALPICKEIADLQCEATTLNNIGTVYEGLGELQKALDAITQALAIHQSTGDIRNQAIALHNMAALYRDLGQKQKALEVYDQALSIYRKIADRQHQATSLSNIGQLYYELGDRQKALTFSEQALSLSRAVADRAQEAITEGNLMLVFHELGKTSLAIFYGKHCINAYQQLRSNVAGLDKQLQKTYLATVEAHYRQLADLLISQGRLPEAQQVLGMLKEEEFFDFVRRDSSEATSLSTRADLTPEEVALDKRYREIADRITVIGREYGQLKEKQARTAEEDRRFEQLDADLIIANKVFQKFLDEIAETFGAAEGRERKFQLGETRGLKDTLRKLGHGAVALYTVIGADRYSIILVTPDVQKAYQTPIAEAVLNEKVSHFVNVLKSREGDPRPLAQELFGILIGSELAKDLELAKAQTLMWSLDGALRYLPVAALHDGKRYLVEQYRNVVFTPASESRLTDDVSPEWKGLGLGVSKAQPGFPPLSDVVEELEGIIRDETVSNPSARRGVVAGRVILDEAFNAATMKASLRQHFSLVHIASHFSFRPGNETKSFLLLGDGSHFSLAEMRTQPDMFSGVQLLTLSACNTAMGGGANGREIESFGVEAQRQGAQAVMATLWAVADESTQLLMRDFYRLRQAHPEETKAEALRQAQIHLLKDAKYSHPYFWAPFILIGNWK